MTEMRGQEIKQDLSEEDIAAYLRAHPGFIKKHPDLLQSVVPPERELGDGVVDFQAFQVKSLQANARALHSKYDMLVDFCRDNLSIQGQVHAAVLRLMRAKSLEQLLEVLTLDLVSLFDLDVVRLAIESEAAGLYDTFYAEDNYSGLSFISPGITDIALYGRQALLLPDTEVEAFPGFEQVFADCENQVLSCAILRLHLQDVPRNAMLAFGVRYKERFHSGQAVDLLSFLAQVVAYQLDAHLKDVDEQRESYGV